ncbi:hypothetical protein DL96DRAFT_1590014 [Flagelloscypha sp. PMI_526]|nr:hypothetical protein DL96DRAFT_1590014 [Flagelloscypha sp. PMI_526]
MSDDASESNAPTSVDPETASLLSYSAQLIWFNQLFTLFVIMGYAFYFPLLIKSIRILLKRVASSVSSRYLLGLTAVLGISTTMHFVSSLSVNFQMLLWPNMGTLDIPVMAKLQLVADAVDVATNVQFFTGRINLSLVDAIVVWRAYVLWPNQRLIRLTLAGSLLITVLFSLILMVFTPEPEKYGMSLVTCNALNIFRDVLALAVNVYATILIAYQGWSLEKTMEGTGAPRPLAAKVLAILVEGGVVLAVLQVLMISLGIITANTLDPADGSYIAFTVVTEILIAASAIYPSMITILVSRVQEPSTSSKSNGSSLRLLNPPKAPHYYPSRRRSGAEGGDTLIGDMSFASAPTSSFSTTAPLKMIKPQRRTSASMNVNGSPAASTSGPLEGQWDTKRDSMY